MKRAIVLLMVLMLLLCCTGCDAAEYKKAMDHYEAGEYAQALEIYRALGDFADSAKMAELCWQKADYEKAEAAFAAGSYHQALTLYQGLNMYMDSPMKAIVCQYRIGLGCIDSGAYEEALTWLEPLGSYEDSQQQVLLAKWLWLHTAIVTKGGEISIKDAGTDGTVLLRANDDGTIDAVYEKQGLLLGVPFESSFTVTMSQGVREAGYQASYLSSSTSQIREEATGTVDLALLTTTSKITPTTFTQTNTDPDGVETVSEDPADSLMLEVILLEARTALAASLPTLLEQTGVNITLQQMGLASLAN